MATKIVPPLRPNPRLSNLIEEGGRSRDYSIVAPKQSTEEQPRRPDSGEPTKKPE